MASGQLRFGLSAGVIADLRGVFERYPEIERVAIFGSRAKGGWDEGSDIDLAVIAAAMPDDRFTALWSQIDSLPLAFKVDCLHWDRLSNDNIKEKIVREGQTFYP
jgi:predicted nucleotidyltransferase